MRKISDKISLEETIGEVLQCMDNVFKHYNPGYVLLYYKEGETYKNCQMIDEIVSTDPNEPKNYHMFGFSLDASFSSRHLDARCKMGILSLEREDNHFSLTYSGRFMDNRYLDEEVRVEFIVPIEDGDYYSVISGSDIKNYATLDQALHEFEERLVQKPAV